MADADGVGYVHCGDGVLVVPLTDDGHVLLAVERSPAFDREVLGLVGGSVEEGEPLEETANRELQEELGWRAERFDFLGELHPFKYLASRHFAFLARDLSPNRLEGDEVYPVRARKVALEGFEPLCRSGELHDAPAIAALCLAREFLAQETKAGDAGQREIMAQAIHENYRRQQAGRRDLQDPAMAEWDELQEDLKESNRQQAADMAAKLARIGCSIHSIANEEVSPITFSDEEIKLLAEMEHERWMAERLQAGWTLGQRDPDRKTSPYLVAYDELPDDVKEWDRQAVRAIPEILALAGLEMYRL
jgi:8-oxo-dGTP pyrophosphatase MutT (NUDIX family)